MVMTVCGALGEWHHSIHCRKRPTAWSGGRTGSRAAPSGRRGATAYSGPRPKRGGWSATWRLGLVQPPRRLDLSPQEALALVAPEEAAERGVVVAWARRAAALEK